MRSWELKGLSDSRWQQECACLFKLEHLYVRRGGRMAEWFRAQISMW